VTENLLNAAVVGVGHSAIYRRDETPLGALTVEACLAAIADSGLTTPDIDGIASNPAQPFDGAGSRDGLEIVTPEFVARAAHLVNLSWSEDARGPVTVADPFLKAIQAVSSGACTTALVYRALHSPAGRRYGQVTSTNSPGPQQFDRAYGVGAASGAALLWQAYLHKYGVNREDMAAIAINARKHGLLWEHGYWYQRGAQQVTREEYVSARMISWPLCLLDCDIPIQGAGAFVITTAERAVDLQHRPAYVVGTAQSSQHVFSRTMSLEDAEARCGQVARDLWRKSNVSVTDVDIANLYDGFTMYVPFWLEAMGFCAPGEGLSFATPETIALTGALPLNTSGGSQGAGRMHGVTHLMESVLQVMGRAGVRQVPQVEVSLAVVGTHMTAGAALFSTRRNESIR
jgi:acetyl-CoA acetyltransferase